MTVRDLVKASLRLLGVLASGEEPTAEEATDGVSALNAMIDSWKNESLMVFTIAQRTFSLIANKKTYSIGPGGDFDMPRPVEIEAVNLLYTASSPLPLVMPVQILNLDQYNAIVMPDITSDPAAVMSCYIDGAYPLRNISFYLVPNAATQVSLYYWQSADSLTGTISEQLSAELALPPGYERALKYNLAVEMANEFAREPLPSTMRVAIESKANIKVTNNRVPLLQVDQALIPMSGLMNIITGGYGRNS